MKTNIKKLPSTFSDPPGIRSLFGWAGGFTQTVLRLAMATVTAGLLLGGSPAGAETIGLNNFDVVNETGQCANNFELFLGGITPDQITYLYNDEGFLNGFPNTQLTQLPGGTLITWTGNTNCDGDASHFGVSLKNCVTPKPVNVPPDSYSWTYNGKQIGLVQGIWQTLVFSNNSVVLQVGNYGLTNIYVQRAYNIVPNELGLSNLVENDPVVLGAHLMDASPVLLQPGAVLTSNLFILPTNNFAVMQVGKVFAAGAGGGPGLQAEAHMAAINIGGGTEVNSMGNYTVTNTTGQVANDFEQFIGGLTNTNGVEFYTTADEVPGYPAYPDVSISLVPGGALVHWSGGTTLPGGVTHFGVRIPGNFTATAQTLPAVQAYWTWNSENIGYVPVTWPITGFAGNNLHNFAIANPFPYPIFIQRRVLLLDSPIDLEDLNVESYTWNTANVLDPIPFALEPGEVVTNVPDLSGLVNSNTYAYALGYSISTTNDTAVPAINFQTAFETAVPTIKFTNIQPQGTNLVLTAVGSYEGFVSTLQTKSDLSPGVAWEDDGDFVCGNGGIIIIVLPGVWPPPPVPDCPACNDGFFQLRTEGDQ